MAGEIVERQRVADQSAAQIGPYSLDDSLRAVTLSWPVGDDAGISIRASIELSTDAGKSWRVIGVVADDCGPRTFTRRTADRKGFEIIAREKTFVSVGTPPGRGRLVRAMLSVIGGRITADVDIETSAVMKTVEPAAAVTRGL